MNFQVNFFEYIKPFLFHFLLGNGGSFSWINSGGLFWVTASGNSWSGQGHKHTAWLKVLMRGIQTLHTSFLALISKTRYEMNITGQVIYLEHYLNDLFDANDRRIFIDDGSPILAPFLFRKVENTPQIIYNKSEGQNPFYLYRKDDFLSQNDFVIMIPGAIPITTDLENRIRAAVNRYKQAGSRYTLENF